MKKLLFTTFIIALLISCKEEPTQVAEIQQQKQIVTDSILHIKIVKCVKQETETSTSYHYKYDLLNSKFRQQPRVESETKYYIVYTNGAIEETTKQKGMFYEKGDTVKTYSYIYK